MEVVWNVYFSMFKSSVKIHQEFESFIFCNHFTVALNLNNRLHFFLINHSLNECSVPNTVEIHVSFPNLWRQQGHWKWLNYWFLFYVPVLFCVKQCICHIVFFLGSTTGHFMGSSFFPSVKILSGFRFVLFFSIHCKINKIHRTTRNNLDNNLAYNLL